MKLRTLKRRYDARTLHRWHFLADLRAEAEGWHADSWDDWDEGDDDSCDGPACGHCGAGVNPHDEDYCWYCGADL